jgi:hypothetical protein
MSIRFETYFNFIIIRERERELRLLISISKEETKQQRTKKATYFMSTVYSITGKQFAAVALVAHKDNTYLKYISNDFLINIAKQRQKKTQ